MVSRRIHCRQRKALLNQTLRRSSSFSEKKRATDSLSKTVTVVELLKNSETNFLTLTIHGRSE